MHNHNSISHQFPSQGVHSQDKLCNASAEPEQLASTQDGGEMVMQAKDDTEIQPQKGVESRLEATGDTQCVNQEVTEWSDVPDKREDDMCIIQGDAMTGHRIHSSSSDGDQLAKHSRPSNAILIASLFHTQIAAYLAILKANVPEV